MNLKLLQRGNRLAGRRCADSHQGRWRQPALAHGFGQQRIGEIRTSCGVRRCYLSHNMIPVRNQNGFPRSSQAQVRTQLVLEDFDADRSHPAKGGYALLLCQRRQC